ncbi:MAG: DUF362 domain-containing protein [Desulfitobacterium sp.]
MCELCLQHGEGKKWYEVMRNYSQELYSQNNREKYAQEFIASSQTTMLPMIEKMAKMKKHKPALYRPYRSIGTWYMKQNHIGQVVPLEDALQVLERAQSITRIPCVCRSAIKGVKNARYCFALGMDPFKVFGGFPELKESLEVLTLEQAKALVAQFDQEGLVHSIWTFKTPFIGALCNCDQDCMAYKSTVSLGVMEVIYKGEYLAHIDHDECVGCRNCLKYCQFGAIEYSVLDHKCSVNLEKCYGCGLCRSGCKKDGVRIEGKVKIQLNTKRSNHP